MIHKESFEVRCADGVRLSGLLIIPESPKAVVQFNGGTAAKKEFYLPFLEYLAAHDYLCCLWDYRGSGASAPENLSTCTYELMDYGLQDMPAIKSYLRGRFPHLPFLFLCHSVGGQQVGFIDELEDVTGMVGFAVSTGYLRHMPWSFFASSIFFFYLFTPISIALRGFLAAKRFGIMENLPRGVVTQWRDWCERKDYFFDPRFYGKSVPKGQFDRLDFPIHIFWTTDDPISNKQSVPTFWSHIKSRKGIDFTQIEPKQIKEKEIGHFGFFKKRMRSKLWPLALTKLEEFLQRTDSKKNAPLESLD
ncbi:MAG: alpha/beta hydrolase [Bacteroidota bacterium]